MVYWVKDSIMNHIKAIGFDLFDTLIIPDYRILADAMTTLLKSLRESGFVFEERPFTKAYRDAALVHMEKARKDGRETRNRFWISEALQSLGFEVTPDDTRVSRAVDSYFALFYPSSRVIPGTAELLKKLNSRYRLGLLSNFTHAPAARELLSRAGIARFFDVILISDELGLRKPRPEVFNTLTDSLGVKNHQALYVGDDPVADIDGAKKAGLIPVWTTIVHDQKLSPTPNPFHENKKVPEEGIPRISTWEDLLSLLDVF